MGRGSTPPCSPGWLSMLAALGMAACGSDGQPQTPVFPSNDGSAPIDSGHDAGGGVDPGVDAGIDAGGAGEGEPCVRIGTCKAGLACFVKDNDPVGKCTRFPDACGSNPTCECAETLGTACTGTCGKAITTCFILSGPRGILACDQCEAYKAEGDACSSSIDCAAGLFCFVKTYATPGTCTKLPEACGASPTCACLEPLNAQCPNPSKEANCWQYGERLGIECAP